MKATEAPEQSLNDDSIEIYALDVLSSALNPAVPEAVACARGAALVLMLRQQGVRIITGGAVR
jgi:hypothetical protein